MKTFIINLTIIFMGATRPAEFNDYYVGFAIGFLFAANTIVSYYAVKK